MKTEIDDSVKNHWKLINGEPCKKIALDEGIDEETECKSTMPSHLGAFIFSSIKRVMNNFICVIDGYKTNNM